jgi:hypothetical protein
LGGLTPDSGKLYGTRYLIDLAERSDFYTTDANDTVPAVGSASTCAWAGLGCEPRLVSTTMSTKPKAASITTHVPLLLAALLSMPHYLSVGEE